jgi:signal transduction histidine kinase
LSRFARAPALGSPARRGGALQRTFIGTLLFAVAAVLATAAQSWVSYRGVQRALEVEFSRRLESVANTIASQVSPDDVREVKSYGDEAHGYGAIEVLLAEFRATSRLADVSVVGTDRQVNYDSRNPDLRGAHAPLDSLAGGEIGRALLGVTAVSRPYQSRGLAMRAAFAPIPTDDGGPVGIVSVEAEPDYGPVLSGLQRDFVLRTTIAVLAMSVLAALFLRLAWTSQRLERRLSRAENLAAMGRLTATLAHEIKNPLAIIRGSAERLGKLDPEARRMADYVVDESDRLSRTVSRYLQFARTDEAGDGRGDAVAALEDTLALLEGELSARRVELRRATAEGGPGTQAAPVPLDNESLKQVYLNLVLNAVEAMSEGGVLTVGASERGGRIEVRISDNGPGIPPEVLSRIGNPFVTTRAQGTGLGLFLTRRLIESAGGTLQIESAPGRGTTCAVRLPRLAASEGRT